MRSWGRTAGPPSSSDWLVSYINDPMPSVLCLHRRQTKGNQKKTHEVQGGPPLGPILSHCPWQIWEHHLNLPQQQSVRWS